jgi:hypothetical protein
LRGDDVYFAAGAEGIGGIKRVAKTGGEPTWLIHEACVNYLFSMTPDGDWIYFGEATHYSRINLVTGTISEFEIPVADTFNGVAVVSGHELFFTGRFGEPDERGLWRADLD